MAAPEDWLRQQLLALSKQGGTALDEEMVHGLVDYCARANEEDAAEYINVRNWWWCFIQIICFALKITAQLRSSWVVKGGDASVRYADAFLLGETIVEVTSSHCANQKVFCMQDSPLTGPLDSLDLDATMLLFFDHTTFEGSRSKSRLSCCIMFEQHDK